MLEKQEVFRIVNKEVDSAIKIFSTGYISREAFSISDEDNQFYMLGSFGLASAIAMGIADNWKHDMVIVFDGDCSFLTNPSSIFLTAQLNLNNFLHIILDNRMSSSTGGQSTYTDNFDIIKIMEGAGYANVQKIEDIDSLEAIVAECVIERKGPYCLWIIVKSDGEQFEKPRVNLMLHNIYNRLKLICSKQ